MKSLLNNTQRAKEKLLEKLKEKVYFCPYCKVIFNSMNRYEDLDQEPFRYQCCNCDNPPFDRSTYIVTAKNKVPIHDNGNPDPILVFNAIAKTIKHLVEAGYSNREIKDVTCFPQTYIDKALQPLQREDIYTISEFYSAELKLSDDEIKTILSSNATPVDLAEKLILTAFDYGCSYNCLAKLLKIDRNTLMLVKRRRNAEINADEQVEIERNALKRTVKRVGEKIKVTYTDYSKLSKKLYTNA